jgi:hypothetical protein
LKKKREKLFLPLASVVGLPPLLFFDNFDGRIQSFVVVIILVITTSTAYKPRGKWGGPGKEKTNKKKKKKAETKRNSPLV